MSDEMKQLKKDLKTQVKPLVANLFKESISSKIVVSGVTLEPRPVMTPGPYWIVYNCIEHMTGVQTIPVTLGRYWPSMSNEFAAQLQHMGNVIIIKERDRFAEEEIDLIYTTYTELIGESFEEGVIADSPGVYFDKCCQVFPGEITTQMRKDFIAHQSKVAVQGEIAGADGS